MIGIVATARRHQFSLLLPGFEAEFIFLEFP